MLRALSEATRATGPAVKEEVAEKALAVVATVARVTSVNFILQYVLLVDTVVDIE